MEKGPKIRMVGKCSEGKKEQFRKKIEELFSNHLNSLSPETQEGLKKFEYPKSEKELAIIKYADQ